MMLIAEPGSSEEIVVTARRREESAQTVPISLNAFSATRLTEASIQTLSDLTALSPGLRFSAEGGAGNTNVSLRGLSKLPIGEGRSEERRVGKECGRRVRARGGPD